MIDRYDVIVVGGGHAGCEAALAAARLSCKTLLLTMSIDSVAAMSCNPVIGGPAAKSHLVREIDALGGEMGKLIDKTYLNIRLLNESRGPAVQALRAQADKKMYQLTMVKTLEDQDNLDVKQGIVSEILAENGEVRGVRLKTGISYEAKALILCTGTFLGGKIVIGSVRYSGGRQGELAADDLPQSLRSLGIQVSRFQTATPPRVDRRSVDFSKMEEQKGSDLPLRFSYETPLDRPRDQVSCWLTHTTEETVKVVRDNIEVSPIRSGSVQGKGPRFCPSIDRKVIRFPDKAIHQIFVEPEGRYTNEMYVLGMTTAMPEEVQDRMIRTIPGLERAKVMRYGYAVEYDFIAPGQLKLSLESQVVAGLFSAGQINGSSGYEEAAAQGLIAGINAARKVKGQSPLILSRSQAYIGVMIDDIVTKGVDEPYRMMTSRAEYRLSLRLSNADVRLTPIGREIGLVSDVRYSAFSRKLEQLTRISDALRSTMCNPTPEVRRFLMAKESGDLGKPVTLDHILQRPEIRYDDLEAIWEGFEDCDPDTKQEIETSVKYSGYIERELKQIEKFTEMEAISIPPDLDYASIPGLRNQARERLREIRPESIGQASRVSGVSPADVTVLMVHLAKSSRPQSSVDGAQSQCVSPQKPEAERGIDRACRSRAV